MQAPVTSGGFSIAPDGAVTGALPPGYTKDNPPSDPSDASLAQRIKSSPNTSGLLTCDQAQVLGRGLFTAKPAAAQEQAAASPQLTGQDHEGCVTAISTIGANGLSFKGQMAGCRRGNLVIHTFLCADGVNVDNGLENDCNKSTGSSVPYTTSIGAPKCRELTNYAHGPLNTPPAATTPPTASTLRTPASSWRTLT